MGMTVRSREISASVFCRALSLARTRLGCRLSRTLIHSTADGDPTPTLGAAREEMVGIAAGLREAGSGVIQVASDFADLDKGFA
jgi:N-acyl-D-aspartate/D-glutamate deacylase